jgi:hypothetical protein
MPSYLSFYKTIRAEVGGDVATSIAHNAFANRQETTSSFVNQS